MTKRENERKQEILREYKKMREKRGLNERKWDKLREKESK